MPHAHYYESVFVDANAVADAGPAANYVLEARFVTIPVPTPFAAASAAAFLAAEQLGMRLVGAHTLPPDWSASDPAHRFAALTAMAYVFPAHEVEAVRFLGDLLSEARIPHEASPMEAVDLSALVTAATSFTGLGAALTIATFGPTPIGILATAGSIVLFGAAEGLAEALKSGLKARIVSWLRT